MDTTPEANRAADPGVAVALRRAATRVMLSTLIQDRMFRAGSVAGAPAVIEQIDREFQRACDVSGQALRPSV